jgi:hypothetical protein
VKGVEVHTGISWFVIPVKAGNPGLLSKNFWIPAFAEGMTVFMNP